MAPPFFGRSSGGLSSCRSFRCFSGCFCSFKKECSMTKTVCKRQALRRESIEQYNI
jgi:hypothetical protein